MEYHDSQPKAGITASWYPILKSLGYRVTARRNVVHPQIGYLFAEQIR